MFGFDWAATLEFITMAALLGLIITHADQIGPVIASVTRIFTNAAHTAAQ